MKEKTFKVLLINPPRENLVSLKTPRVLNIDLGEISSFPPVGLMYVAQAARQRNPDFDIRIMDAVAERLSHAEVLNRVVGYAPDVVGLTASTYTFYDVWLAARNIKKQLPDTPVVAGGVHMHTFARQTMLHECFDYGVAGDGEEVFNSLCAKLQKKEKPIPVDGLYWREGRQVCGSGVAVLEDLDTMAFPAVDLIDPRRYYSTIGRGQAVGTICTSRGCPFRCTFCQVPHVPYRVRSVDNVIKEIEEYRKKGIADFFFFDDLFNITKKRLADFCAEVLRRGLKIGFMFRGRVDQLDDEVLRLARKAGCHTISIGIEDATDEGLENIKKNITLRQAFECVRLIRKNRIICSANWMLGLPMHRSTADLEQLLKTAISINSDYAQFSVLQAMPGSELYAEIMESGGFNSSSWEDYVSHPAADFNPPVWEKYIDKEGLLRFYERAYKAYYLRPRFIFAEIMRVRSFRQAYQKFKLSRHIFWRKPLKISALTLANSSQGTRIRRKYALAQLKKLKDPVVLEAGCGVGAYSKKIAEFVPRLYAFDLNSKLVLSAKDGVPGSHFFSADISGLPLKKEVFDAVLATDVLEHLRQPDKALKDIYAVLKPGGSVFVSVPSEEWGAIYKAVGLNKEDFGHFHLYGLAAVKTVFEKSGFRLVKHKKIQSCVSAFIDSLVVKMSIMAHGRDRVLHSEMATAVSVAFLPAALYMIANSLLYPFMVLCEMVFPARLKTGYFLIFQKDNLHDQAGAADNKK